MLTPLEQEKELMLKTAGGDQAAFADIFHHYRNKIFSVVFKLTDSLVLSEEIVQDVFLKLWLQRERLAEIEKLDGWLFIIARNATYNALRHSAHKNFGLEELPETLPSLDEDSVDRFQEKQYQVILSEAIERLPPQQQQAYRLSREEGLSREQIAQKLSVSPETVKTHLRYALRSVRAYCLSRMDLTILLLVLWKTS